MLLRSSILGAIDGLIVGSAAEFIRQTYGEYQWRAMVADFESQGMSPPLMVDMLRWWAIPFTSTIAFILVVFIVYRFVAAHLKSPILFWQIIGVGGVIVWGILWQLINLAGPPPPGPFSLIGDIRRLQAGYTLTDLIISGSFFRDWLVILLLAMIINLLYGALLQLTATLSRSKRVSPGAT